MKRFILIACFLVLTVISSVKAQEGEDVAWQKVAEDSYIDPDGIVGSSDMYGFSFLLKAYNKGQYEPVNGNSIWYTLSQYTIDCAKQKYKIGMIWVLNI